MTRSSHAEILPIASPASDPRATLALLTTELRAARLAVARGSASAVSHTARGLLTSLTSTRVRIELAHAAAAFAEALDERPFAQSWVFFAVSARAVLEQAIRLCPELLGEVSDLDEAFEDAREAVLLLEPEDYREALAGVPADKTAWWGERARLDAGLREVDLERALGDVEG